MAHVYKIISGGGAGGGGGGSSSTYSESFSSGNWVGPSGGEYTYTILQSVHEKGTDPIVQVFENNAGVFELVETGVEVDSFGNVTITVNETPDTRFPGRVVII